MKIIITGSSGMVGKSILLECLGDNSIKKILLLNRSTAGIRHEKIIEALHADFSDISGIKEALKGYDACFHCMGVSAAGMGEEEYYKTTYTLTEELVNTLYELSPQMVFNYVSGLGTDGTEKGKIRWARVKGKTENLVLNKGFRDAYAYRPGIILPEKGVKSKTPWYNAMYTVLRPLFPMLKKLKSVTTGPQLGKSMLYTLNNSMDNKVLNNSMINKMAEAYR